MKDPAWVVMEAQGRWVEDGELPVYVATSEAEADAYIARYPFNEWLRVVRVDPPKHEQPAEPPSPADPRLQSAGAVIHATCKD